MANQRDKDKSCMSVWLTGAQVSALEKMIMDAVLRENAKIGAQGAIEALRVAGYQVSGLEIDLLFSYIFDALKRAEDEAEA